MRADQRDNKEIRKITITGDILKYPYGSVLIRTGDTIVLCTASVEEKVPSYIKGSGRGWITAEYSMLPASNAQRKQRDISRLRLDSRSAEIQRLIGRSLRSSVDLSKLGERTIWIDCDVLQADGGTRTASVTGGFVALYSCINRLMSEGLIKENPLSSFTAAVSVGIVDGEVMLDLCYTEDSQAIADSNFVMNERGEFIEIQATGEARPIAKAELIKMTEYAEYGITQLIAAQKSALGMEPTA